MFSNWDRVTYNGKEYRIQDRYVANTKNGKEFYYSIVDEAEGLALEELFHDSVLSSVNIRDQLDLPMTFSLHGRIGDKDSAYENLGELLGYEIVDQIEEQNRDFLYVYADIELVCEMDENLDVRILEVKHVQ